MPSTVDDSVTLSDVTAIAGRDSSELADTSGFALELKCQSIYMCHVLNLALKC